MDGEAKRWYDLKGDDCGKAAYEIAISLYDDQSERRARCLENLCAYEGRDLDNLSPSSYVSGGRPDDIQRNIARAAVESVCADIAGRSKPTVKLQTYGGNWKTKRQAKQLEKYVQGHIRRRQGQYLNGWALGEQLFRDAAVLEFGVAHIFGVPKAGETPAHIAMERMFCWELVVDPTDAMYGDPNCVFRVRAMDQDQALWALCEDPSLELTAKQKKRNYEAIMLAEEAVDEHAGKTVSTDDTRRAGKRIRVVEAFRRARPDGRPGKHIFCVENATLICEDWKRETFPFLRVFWAKDMLGWHGLSLVEEGITQHDEINVNAKKLQERFRLCGSKRTYVPKDAILNPDDLMANEAETIIFVDQNAKFTPHDNPPAPIAESEFAYYQDLIGSYWNDRGISEMRATSRKEPGIESGVALRTVNDLGTQRFSLKARGYEWMYTEMSEHIFDCSKELDEAEEDLSSFMDEEIRWREVRLPRTTFEISSAPISSLPNDPAGRLAMIEEVFASGVISVDAYKRLLQWSDLDSELNAQTSQQRWIEKYIGLILDATDERAYKTPDSYLPQKEMALLQISQAYFEALYEEAPEHVLKMLRKALEDLQAMLVARDMAQQMAAAGAMGGAPPPGGPEGAPPEQAQEQPAAQAAE